jgi:predicted AlkP superfamily phosphohydrolase/phosphomutase
MLPTIRSMLEKGFVGETMSIEGLYEGATWPSFYTGTHPAHHGFHSLKQLNPGTYEFYRCYPGDFIKFGPFWKYLSAAGLRTAILDIPLSGISGGLNGIQMVEWGSHDGVYGFHTWPLKLKWDVLARFGRHPLRISCDSYQRAPHEFSAFKDKLINGVKKKAELTIHYLGKDNWNFFAQVFTEGHCIGHQCWHLHDPEHPSHDPQVANYTGDPIYDVYKAIDRAIGKILEHVTDDTLIFLLASHGMTHNIGGNFLISEILERLGLAKKWVHDADGRKPKSKNAIENLYHVIGQGWQKIPIAIKKRFRPALFSLHNLILHKIRRGDLLILPWAIAHIDLRNSKCFPLLNGNPVSGIRINLSGREPDGLIQPGKELNDFCDELTKDLLGIVDYDTGKPMVRKVRKVFQSYDGERVDHLPDLLVEWNDEKILGSLGVGDVKNSRLRILSKKIGIVEGVNTYCRTGDHRPEGFFIVVGPGINAGHMDKIVSIMDFAPTFTNLFGVEMPKTDGNPIIDILEMVRSFRGRRSQ